MKSQDSSKHSPKLEELTEPELDWEIQRRNRRKINRYYPDTGQLYRKHLSFFRASAQHRERLLMAGNRCGKTTAGAYEMTVHLTGQYPDWWEGRRFTTAIDAWAAGDTSKTVRDILQHELLGPTHARGTGMIPGDAIVRMTNARGVADAVDRVFVRHVSGGVSVLGFKSYSEGRKNFQGTAKHVIWFDEEPSIEVYTEALMRTMKVPGTDQGGMMIVTFTPLQGYTEVVTSFLEASDDNAPPPVASTQ